ncbi:SRPBCC family protein [Piscinibacter gummiphilus]|uniref:SRPBCC family protein n=1 Tax=Piscinibacter gummiphilus TaxID=946333 RepID=A0ABZ0CPK2_9BURK|nr:SRPBCC family protein [Piscinibacter gummiphilus]WOB06903.1 SRPBCC family protein [Piscinibacter gummiphilus]
MASIHRSVQIQAPASQVWNALQDVGALHTKLVPGFVVDCRLEGEARHVTFANGMTAKEHIVDVSSERMRVSWSAVGGRLTHHNASAQVIPTGETSCEVIWIADLLPHEMASPIAGMIEQGLKAMKTFQESKNAA